MVVRPERLFAAVPRILRCAPDRCRALRGSVQLGRTAKLSNSLAFGWEFELRRRALGTCEGFSCKEYGGAPGEIVRGCAANPPLRSGPLPRLARQRPTWPDGQVVELPRLRLGVRITTSSTRNLRRILVQ